MLENRIFDENWGFGDIVLEDNGFYFVRFDADPWSIHKIPKERE